MILEKVSSSLIWIILLHISLTEEITGQIMLLSHQLSTCNAIWHSLDKPKYGWTRHHTTDPNNDFTLPDLTGQMVNQTLAQDRGPKSLS